ncbi:MAG TPA: hypothetical protein VK517_08480 [Cyclobacteriaceae bacterium]|nr:hypothetical protein [Cyclobacteriaceae bacterium]
MLTKIGLFLSVCLAMDAVGQSDPGPLIKMGGFVYFLDSKYNGFSAHLEFERAFRRSQFLTSGPRIDFINFKNSDGAFMVGYEFKIYPLYWKSRKSYQGLFIGIDPVYLPKNPDIYYSRYGPGIGSLFGYQHVFKDKISIALEGSLIYIKDLNKQTAQYNPDHTYLYAFACIKVGFKL